MPGSEARRREPDIPGARRSRQPSDRSCSQAPGDLGRALRSVYDDTLREAGARRLSQSHRQARLTACVPARSTMTLGERFARLPTAAKLLLILTARSAADRHALALARRKRHPPGQCRALQAAARTSRERRPGAIESLIARNALALRIAANGSACRRHRGCLRADAQRRFRIAPAVAQNFELETATASRCAAAATSATPARCRSSLPATSACGSQPDARRDRGARRRHRRNGDRARPGRTSCAARALAAIGGRCSPGASRRPTRTAGDRTASGPERRTANQPNGRSATATCSRGSGRAEQQITTLDRLVLLLPLLMWIAAALITWLLVSRLLVGPLKRLERAVRAYRPGRSRSICRAGSARRRRSRSCATRSPAPSPGSSESEREMTGALEGQRRLVREVHHRVKNNLQVVASLLNIHGRSAERSRSARRPMPGSAAGSARCRSSTATISRKWRRIAGSRCVR